jgi:hypothetical protein
MAAMTALLHITPLSGAITLLVLHWTKCRVGGPSLEVLQFDRCIDYDFSGLENLASLTSFDFIRTFNGYGYGSTDTPTQLALAVIVTYCIITTLYIAYTITSGRTSIAWNS